MFLLLVSSRLKGENPSLALNKRVTALPRRLNLSAFAKKTINFFGALQPISTESNPFHQDPIAPNFMQFD